MYGVDDYSVNFTKSKKLNYGATLGGMTTTGLTGGGLTSVTGSGSGSGGAPPPDAPVVTYEMLQSNNVAGKLSKVVLSNAGDGKTLATIPFIPRNGSTISIPQTDYIRIMLPATSIRRDMTLGGGSSGQTIPIAPTAYTTSFVRVNNGPVGSVVTMKQPNYGNMTAQKFQINGSPSGPVPPNNIIRMDIKDSTSRNVVYTVTLKIGNPPSYTYLNKTVNLKVEVGNSFPITTRTPITKSGAISRTGTGSMDIISTKGSASTGFPQYKPVTIVYNPIQPGTVTISTPNDIDTVKRVVTITKDGLTLEQITAIKVAMAKRITDLTLPAIQVARQGSSGRALGSQEINQTFVMAWSRWQKTSTYTGKDAEHIAWTYSIAPLKKKMQDAVISGKLAEFPIVGSVDFGFVAKPYVLSGDWANTFKTMVDALLASFPGLTGGNPLNSYVSYLQQEKIDAEKKKAEDEAKLLECTTVKVNTTGEVVLVESEALKIMDSSTYCTKQEWDGLESLGVSRVYQGYLVNRVVNDPYWKPNAWNPLYKMSQYTGSLKTRGAIATWWKSVATVDQVVALLDANDWETLGGMLSNLMKQSEAEANASDAWQARKAFRDVMQSKLDTYARETTSSLINQTGNAGYFMGDKPGAGYLSFMLSGEAGVFGGTGLLWTASLGDLSGPAWAEHSISSEVANCYMAEDVACVYQKYVLPALNAKYNLGSMAQAGANQTSTDILFADVQAYLQSVGIAYNNNIKAYLDNLIGALQSNDVSKATYLMGITDGPQAITVFNNTNNTSPTKRQQGGGVALMLRRVICGNSYSTSCKPKRWEFINYGKIRTNLISHFESHTEKALTECQLSALDTYIGYMVNKNYSKFGLYNNNNKIATNMEEAVGSGRDYQSYVQEILASFVNEVTYAECGGEMVGSDVGTNQDKDKVNELILTGDTDLDTCFDGTHRDANGNCVSDTGTCPEGTELKNGICTAITGGVACSAGKTWNGSACVDTGITCDSGYTWDSLTASCNKVSDGLGKATSTVPTGLIIGGVALGVLALAGVGIAVAVGAKKKK